MPTRIPSSDVDAQIAAWKAKGLDMRVLGVKRLEKKQKAAKLAERKSIDPLPSSASVELDLWVPILVVSEANQREHWAVKNRRRKAQQAAVLAVLEGFAVPSVKSAFLTFTRVSSGWQSLDSDNLAGAFKGTRDAVCKWLGVDDGDKRLVFDYRQETRAKHGGVRIKIVANVG